MIEENIIISGDASEGIAAMQNMESAVNGFFENLEGRAAHRFEHVGLSIIIGQLFAMEGASGHANAGLRIAEAGMFALFSAAGLVSAPMAILVGAGAAVAAAFSGAGQAAAEESKELKKLETQMLSFIDKQDQVTAADRRLAAVKLNEVQNSIRETQRSINEESNAVSNQQVELDRLRHIWRTTTDDVKMLAAIEKQWMDIHGGDISKASEKTAAYQVKLEGLSQEEKHLIDIIHGQTEAHKKNAEEAEKEAEIQKKGLSEVSAAQNAMLAHTKALADEDKAITGDLYKSKISTVQKFHDHELSSIEEKYRKALAAANKYDIDTTGIERTHSEEVIQLEKTTSDKRDQVWREMVGLNKNATQEMEEFGIHSFQQLSKGFGDSVAKNIVEGKNFTQSMNQLFKQMEEAFITEVIAMTAQWLAFMAVKTAATGGIGAFFATGTDMIVDQPTPFIAGEAGAERVTVTPLGGQDNSEGDHSGGGGGGVNIGSISVNVAVSGTSDPQGIARQIAPYIIQEIRGRAQLSFSGPSIF